MDVLVTGGAGYIGSFLVGKLLDKGYNVRVLDLMLFGDSALDEHMGREHLEIVRGDIRHIRDLTYAVKGVDAVVHLAGIVGDPACDQNVQATQSANVEATKALMEICNYHRVNRLIYASSCSVYGYSELPWINEGSRLNPLSLYAQSKADSEQIILDSAGYFQNNRIVPTILRFGTIFGWGKRMRFDLVANLLTAKAVIDGEITIFGGKQFRPFLHVEDAADSCLAALEAEDGLVDRQIFNVGDNALNYRISDLGKLISKIIPEADVKQIDKKEDERSYKVAFDKINYVLKWETQWDMNVGLMEMRDMVRREVRDYTADKYRNSSCPYF